MIDIEFAEKIYFKEKTHATNTYTHNRTETPVIYGLNSFLSVQNQKGQMSYFNSSNSNEQGKFGYNSHELIC